MEAIVAHAVDEAMVVSQSLARRRHRLSHAKVRSTTREWNMAKAQFAVLFGERFIRAMTA